MKKLILTIAMFATFQDARSAIEKTFKLNDGHQLKLNAIAANCFPENVQIKHQSDELSDAMAALPKYDPNTSVIVLITGETGLMISMETMDGEELAYNANTKDTFVVTADAGDLEEALKALLETMPAAETDESVTAEKTQLATEEA